MAYYRTCLEGFRASMNESDSGEIGRLEKNYGRILDNAQLFGAMMIFFGWSKYLFALATHRYAVAVDCAFEGLPCALCLEAVLEHPMRPGFANFWRSSFHSQSHSSVQMSSAEEADFPHNLSCWPGAVQT